MALGLSAGAAHALETVTLQLKWRHQFQFAGYYAALEQGYYREAGLDVRIVPATPETDPVAEVVAGRADFGVSSSGLVLARHAGLPVVALAVIFQHSPLVLMTLNNGQLDNIHQLAGRKVMIAPHEDELLAYLQAEGVANRNLQLVPHSFDHKKALLEQGVAAVSAYSTDEPELFLHSGIPIHLLSPRSVGIDFYGDTLFTVEEQIRRHPDRVRAFRAASLQGWQYAMAHPQELVHLIRRQYAPDMSVEHLRYEAEQMERLIQPELVEMGYMNPGRWQHIATTYGDLGMLPVGWSPDGFLYDPDNRVDWSIALRWIGGLLAALVVGGGSGAYILTLNRRLKREMAEKERVLQVLQASESRYRALTDSMADVVWQWNPRARRFSYVSPSATRLLGFSLPEILAAGPEMVVAEASRTYLDEVMPARIRAVLNDQPGSAEATLDIIEMRRKDGSTVWVEMVTRAVRMPSQVVEVVGVARDITARRRQEQELATARADLELSNRRLVEMNQELERLASTDKLTGTFNRRYFEKVAALEVARARRYGHGLALILFDLDRFKQINDRHGHQVGDQVLSQVADLVRRQLRASDTLARWGGEEFVILVPESDGVEAGQLAEKLRQAVAGCSCPSVGGLTISLGVALFTPADSLDDWLFRADQALYAAKSGGRNQVSISTQEQA